MKKILKSVSCFAVILMVVSILPSDALAAEDGGQDYENLKFGRMSKFTESGMDVQIMKEKFHNGDMVRNGEHAGHIKNMRMVQERPEFETEAEKFEYFQTRVIESIDRKIERLENAKENIDEIENEEITVELLDSYIEQLEELKEDVENAEALEELENIRESIRSLRYNFFCQIWGMSVDEFNGE